MCKTVRLSSLWAVQCAPLPGCGSQPATETLGRRKQEQEDSFLASSLLYIKYIINSYVHAESDLTSKLEVSKNRTDGSPSSTKRPTLPDMLPRRPGHKENIMHSQLSFAATAWARLPDVDAVRPRGARWDESGHWFEVVELA